MGKTRQTGFRRTTNPFPAAHDAVHIDGPMAVVSPLKVGNVRLEPPPPTERLPAVLLKFDVVNVSSNRLTDLVLKVSILEKPHVLDGATDRILVGPFEIRGRVVLEPGYALNYQLLLRNLTVDCGCVAKVEPISQHSFPYPDNVDDFVLARAGH